MTTPFRLSQLRKAAHERGDVASNLAYAEALEKSLTESVAKGAYPTATLQMNSMGHVHAWPGDVQTGGNRQNKTADGKESLVYFQLDSDVQALKEYLTPDEWDDLQGGYRVVTTNFPDDYFALEAGAASPFRKAAFAQNAVDNARAFAESAVMDDETVDPPDVPALARANFSADQLQGITDEMLVGWAQAKIDGLQGDKNKSIIADAQANGFEQYEGGFGDFSFTRPTDNGGAFDVAYDARTGSYQLKYSPPSQERSADVWVDLRGKAARNSGAFRSFKQIAEAVSNYEDNNYDYFHRDESDDVEESARAPFRKAKPTQTTLYARLEPTTDSATMDMRRAGGPAAQRQPLPLDVVLYKDPAAKVSYTRYPWSSSTKPTQRDTTVNINSGTFNLEWLPPLSEKSSRATTLSKKGQQIVLSRNYGPSTRLKDFMTDDFDKVVDAYMEAIAIDNLSQNPFWKPSKNEKQDTRKDLMYVPFGLVITLVKERAGITFLAPRNDESGKAARAPFHKHERTAGSATLTKGVTCECADKGCPVHKGTSKCTNKATTNLRRVDMDDVSGTMFCEACAEDALESGLFREDLGAFIRGNRKAARAPFRKHERTADAATLTKRAKFRVGDHVKMTDDALENYGEKYRDEVFTITSVSTKYMPSKQFFAQGKPEGYHPGYDEGMNGQGLYDLDGFNSSLYDYELESA